VGSKSGSEDSTYYQVDPDLPKMHKATASNAGLFSKGGSLFGGSKTPTSTTRPNTSSGSPSAHKESRYDSPPNSRITGFSRKPSFSTTTSTSKSPGRTILRSRTGFGAASIYSSPEKRTGTIDVKENPKSADSFAQVADIGEVITSPESVAESFNSTTPYSNMLARTATGGGYQASGPTGMSVIAPLQPVSPTLETITYQHIQEMASKRISTLDYLRKA